MEYTIFYLFHNRIINNSNNRDFPNRKSNGNTHEREPTKKKTAFVFVFDEMGKENTQVIQMGIDQ